MFTMWTSIGDLNYQQPSWVYLFGHYAVVDCVIMPHLSQLTVSSLYMKIGGTIQFFWKL